MFAEAVDAAIDQARASAEERVVAAGEKDWRAAAWWLDYLDGVRRPKPTIDLPASPAPPTPVELTPEDDAAAVEHQRERLEAVLLRLGQRFDCGELPESEYRGKVADIRRQLAALPSPDDKLVLFDRYRSEVRSFAETLAGASEEKVRELVALLIDRVETADRAVGRVVWSAPARPFFLAAAANADDRALCGVAPPDGFEPPTQAL